MPRRRCSIYSADAPDQRIASAAYADILFNRATFRPNSPIQSRNATPSSLTLLILVNVKEPYVLVEGKTRLRVAAPRHRRLTRRIMLFIVRRIMLFVVRRIMLFVVRRISERFKNLRLRSSRSGRVYSRVKQSFDDSVERDLDTRCSCRHDGC